MKIHDFKQHSPEWNTVRLGKVTASEADSLVSPEGKIRTGEGPKAYLCRKVCEKILGYAQETGGTFQMDQGTIAETVALPWYAFTFDRDIRRVGFCESFDGRFGCSPDALVGEDGGVEIKHPAPPLHLRYLIEGVVPKDYVIQVQFCLWVTGRRWWDFVSFSRQFNPLVVRVEKDPKLQDAISEALAQFADKFDAVYTKIKNEKDAENAAKSLAYAEQTDDQTRA